MFKQYQGLLSGGAIHALGELLGTVVFVQEVVGDFLEVGQMAVQKSSEQ